MGRQPAWVGPARADGTSQHRAAAGVFRRSAGGLCQPVPVRRLALAPRRRRARCAGIALAAVARPLRRLGQRPGLHAARGADLRHRRARRREGAGRVCARLRGAGAAVVRCRAGPAVHARARALGQGLQPQRAGCGGRGAGRRGVAVHRPGRSLAGAARALVRRRQRDRPAAVAAVAGGAALSGAGAARSGPCLGRVARRLAGRGGGHALGGRRHCRACRKA
jgi:hypothetical protein